jgi:hypothetical protein
MEIDARTLSGLLHDLTTSALYPSTKDAVTEWFMVMVC